MDKSGPTVPSLDYIVAHYAIYDVGKGMVYVVQVVSTRVHLLLSIVQCRLAIVSVFSVRQKKTRI